MDSEHILNRSWHDLRECFECGAVLIDPDRHEDWHWRIGVTASGGNPDDH